MGKRDLEAKKQTPEIDLEVGGDIQMSTTSSINWGEIKKNIPEENAEAKREPNIVGTVIDCWKLNVREEPNPDSKVMGTIDHLSEVMIDDTESTDKYYKVCTASGIEGFCLRNYIKV